MKGNATPILSICVPSYNYGHFLPDMFDSILGQDFEDFELIIVDDGSTDHSHQVIESYAHKDKRIRPFLRKKNRGLFATFEEAISYARGEFLHLFAADDLYLPGFLSATMTLLLENPQVPICGSDFTYFEGTPDHMQTEKSIPTLSGPIVLDAETTLRTMQHHRFWLPGGSVIMKSDLYKQYGGYNQTLGPASDWFLIHSIVLQKGCGYIPKPLVATRVHEQCYSQQPNSLKKTVYSLFKELDDPKLRSLFARSTLLRFHLYSFPGAFLRNPKFWPALFFIAKRFALKPSLHKRIVQTLEP